MHRADLDVLNREQLIELVLGLAQQVAELKARLELPAKTPENSSLPPSHGHKPGGGGRRKGRRKGRPGTARTLDPNPTAMREIRAACCPHCQGGIVETALGLCEIYMTIESPLTRPECTRGP